MLTLALLLLLQDTPVEVSRPQAEEALRPWKLIRVSDGKAIPCQVSGPTLVFLAPPGSSDYRLERGAPEPFPDVQCVDDGKSLIISVRGKSVLSYNYAVIEQPDPVFSRSGYLHPIWTPSGKVVTNDSPPNHLHHHGIWSAWTSSEFEGRKSNFWESKEKQGKVKFFVIEETFSGPVFAGFKVRHRFLNLNGPDGPKVALEEVWTVRVYALTDRFVFDLESFQAAATEQPLIIKEYRYGGIGFRGPAAWEGKAGVEFLTSEGKDRIEGHATRAKWVVATGKIDGEERSVGFFCHPSNFRYPQPVRIHPDEPFFNWAVPQAGDFSIDMIHGYMARYRFVVADGKRTAQEMAADWTAYGEARKVALTLGK
jgi:hypothetical protein